MKKVSLGQFLTDDQIAECVKYHPDKNLIRDKVIIPDLENINKKIGQENDPDYLAYAVIHVLNTFLKQDGS